MNVFKINKEPFSGSKYTEVYKKAYLFYKSICLQTKRRPYIRAKYFKNDKIFLGIFWQHLKQKNWKDRIRRLKYFECGIAFLKENNLRPLLIKNLNDENKLYRFKGTTNCGKFFYVQIKENNSNSEKILLSIFPEI